MSARKKASTAISQPSESRKLEDAVFELLFQRIVPSIDCICLSSTDIKLYSLKVGARVVVSTDSTCVICTVYASKASQSGVAIMGKSLQSNFESKQGLKIKISSDFRRCL